jgi:tRNA nucleotidyltransferase (CCA-adding enzyme)
LTTEPGWSHFEHRADIGIEGYGPSLASAFEQAALALTAIVCDPDRVQPTTPVAIHCEDPDMELLFVDWLNALIYRMAADRMLFARFDVHIDGRRLSATAWGEPVDPARHEPAVEPKGATFTALSVQPLRAGAGWYARCVIDV